MYFGLRRSFKEGPTMHELVPDTLLNEYEQLVETLGKNATRSQLIELLVRDHAWSQEGAATIVTLSTQYGTSILRNAVALAAAMQVEDGEAGL